MPTKSEQYAKSLAKCIKKSRKNYSDSEFNLVLTGVILAKSFILAADDELAAVVALKEYQAKLK